MSMKTGSIVKYALLPGIIPRIRAFLAAGFGHLAIYMAYAYRAARLLPDGHPYLSPSNIGKFGLRHVIAAARRNVVHSRAHLDQVIIFYTLILGVFLLFFQFVLLFLSLIATQARADAIGDYFRERFVTPFPDTDLAYILLDRVFCFGPADGRDAIYGSNVVGTACPTPMHTALHELFHFYNLGVLGIALVIFMYFVVTVVGETAQSGTPFGKRFNHAMVPLRLILAIGLLVPLSYGLNGAQLTTLFVTKWGSSLATNGWNKFTDRLAGETVIGMPNNLVVKPTPPQLNTLLEFIFVAHTCRYIEYFVNHRENPEFDEFGTFTGWGPSLYAYQLFETDSGWQSVRLPDTLNEALNNSGNQEIIIRLGEYDSAYADDKGNVKPICGEIVMQIKDISTWGGKEMQSQYYYMIWELLTDPIFIEDAENVALRMTPTVERDPTAPIPTIDDLQSLYVDYFNAGIAGAISRGYAEQINEERWCTVGQECWNESIRSKGWAGAGIWYNKIAELNGGLIAAAFNLPVPSLYPEVMEYVKWQREQNNAFVDGPERFNPYLPDGTLMPFAKASDMYVAMTLYYAQSFWKDVFTKPKGNPFIDTINALFGIQGLIEISNNVDTHPLAQLTGIGRALIESAVMNLGYSFGAGIMGGILSIAGMTPLATVGAATSKFMMNIALIGLAQGFILFYVLPFLPFVYFFFAVGGWLKGIFEALIGLPLWAVAHIRIDGQGIPGPVGMSGYYMILEIFLRPILIIFGLIASISIFAALVRVLHSIWPLVVINVTGHNPDSAGTTAIADTASMDYFRESVDEFFYMILYTVIVYMLAMSSFKLIDQIPARILRWVGSSVSNFSDFASNPGGELIGKAYMGSTAIISQAQGGMSSTLKFMMMRN